MFWVSVSWRPVRDEHSNVAALCTFLVDIGERRATEEALRKADERYRVLAENSSDMFWEMEMDGTFSFVSPAIRCLGYTPDEWIGHNLLEILPPDEQSVFVNRMRRDASAPGPRRYEVRALAKTGAEIWMEVLTDFVFEGGKPVRIQGTARDITQRRQAEEALRESEQKYKSIVENSSDLIMLLRSDGTVAYASPAMRTVYGYEPEVHRAEDLAGTSGRRQRVMAARAEALRGGSVSGSNFEYRIITKSGQTKWISHSWSAIMDGDRVQMIVSIVRDITERKQSEEALRQGAPRNWSRPTGSSESSSTT